jgi:uroporphyrin-III C-methyltransferase / precorrin-2 dehydrogenase / sirohydrochlorin ferrochelatase
MRYLPLFIDLQQRRVVVVGGGAIAARKVALLLEAGAQVEVMAPQLGAELVALAECGRITHCAGSFSADGLTGARLVVAATGSPAVNRAVALAAEARAIQVNVVDDAKLSTCVVPAIVDRSPLLVAVGTAGAAPMLARHVRARIESLIDESFGRLAQVLGRLRLRIRARQPALADRRRLYDQLVTGPFASLIRAGRVADAEALLEQALEEPQSPAGRVLVVGAGPGDPGLLTLNALRALQAADVVLHDRLVSEEVLALIRRDARVIEVGKSHCGGSTAQAEIHRLMVEHAGAGRTVVRLKGGDPFIFGRGGEELEHLRAAGIHYEVVPGVTAASACAAYAGIPLTHREHSKSVRLVTAHGREAIDAIDWRSLATSHETLAIYMGVATVGRLQRELLRFGLDGTTPIAFVENGTLATQRVILGRLGQATSLAEVNRLKSPALLIVGSVAALAARLHWFGAPPLSSEPGGLGRAELAA